MMFRITSCITSDQDDECLITVRYIGAIFYLRWSPNTLASAPKLLEAYLAHLHELRDEDDDSEGLLTELVRPLNDLMSQLAPPSKHAPFSLHDYLYPPWFQLEATAADNGRTIQPVDMNKADSPFGLPGEVLHSKRILNLELNSWVTRWFPSHEIELSADGERHPLLYSPFKVVTKQSRTECFFKDFGAGCQGTIHELVAFRAIDDAFKRGALPPDTRVCRLYGLVVDTVGLPSSSLRLVGMLLSYIKPKRRDRLGTLQCVAYEDGSRKHLRRWANDLDDIVSAIHRAGCIWGDAKPENVLIDNDDNVWLIDFGGGYTAGWVDKEQQCTEKGDMEAVKIQQWLDRLSTNCQTV
ncbi:hypothetical protein JX266_014055 [Neoarthrinium moseri]|nr:hypothetical protein JX266_014055 [Neoarthrinium moseri]